MPAVRPATITVAFVDHVCSDAVFHPLIAEFQDDMVVLTDMGFHAKVGNPPNL